MATNKNLTKVISDYKELLDGGSDFSNVNDAVYTELLGQPENCVDAIWDLKWVVEGLITHFLDPNNLNGFGNDHTRKDLGPALTRLNSFFDILEEEQCVVELELHMSGQYPVAEENRSSKIDDYQRKIAIKKFTKSLSNQD